jgi:hypothetical protein
MPLLILLSVNKFNMLKGSIINLRKIKKNETTKVVIIMKIE